MCKRLVHLSKPLLAVLLLTLLPTGCSTNPVNGWTEAIIISRQQEIAMGSQALPKFETSFGACVPTDRLQSYGRLVGC